MECQRDSSGHVQVAITSCARDSHGRIARSPESRQEFMTQTGYPHGRPGYVVVPTAFADELERSHRPRPVQLVLQSVFASHSRGGATMSVTVQVFGRRRVTSSMTSSARSRSASGTVRPRAFAVLRLTTSSNLVGRSTGRSAGLAPLRIFPT